MLYKGHVLKNGLRISRALSENLFIVGLDCKVQWISWVRVFLAKKDDLCLFLLNNKNLRQFFNWTLHHSSRRVFCWKWEAMRSWSRYPRQVSSIGDHIPRQGQCHVFMSPEKGWRKLSMILQRNKTKLKPFY